MMEQMDKSTARTRRRRTSSTRRVMLGAFVGAVVAVVLSTAFAAQIPGLGSTDKRVRAAAFDAKPGSCFQWTKQDMSDMRQVPCADQHLMEMSGSVNLSNDYPKNAPFPDQQTGWPQIVKKSCTQLTSDFLGGRLDPYGKFSVTALKPTAQGWAAGDRSMECGLQVVTASNTIVAFAGAVAGQDQSDVHPVGTCLGIKNRMVTEPVDCALPHAWEIVGQVDLGPSFRDVFPKDTEQDTVASQKCNAAAAEYAGGPNAIKDKGQGLTVTWDDRKQESWLAGSRKVDCKVGAPLADNSALAAVTGSIKGQVGVDTTVPTPTASRSATPEG
jgi:hypothetical protein